MSIAEVTLPDGRVAEIEFSTPEQLDAAVNDLTGHQQQSAPPQPEAAPDPSAGGATLNFAGFDTGIKTPEVVDRALAGAGKAITDIGRGAGQMLGMVSDEDVAESRRLDAPLMATTAGKVGNVVGSIAATVPALAIPGANTVAGAGLIGAGLGALQPVAEGESRLKNAAVSGAVGAAAQGIGGKISSWAQKKIASRAAMASSAEAQNAVRDATLKEARKVGYVVPPSTTNPTAINRAVESISGKAATQQTAAVRNQQVTNRLVRQELGMGKDAPITKQALNNIRSTAGNAYKAVKAAGKIVADDTYLDDLANISKSIDEVAKDFPDANVGSNEQIDKLVNSLLRDDFQASSAVEYVKKLRADASGNLSFAASADPSKKALGLAQRDAAGALEDMVIRHLENNGKGALAQQFDKARQLIAKTYSVEAALTEGSGNVVATNLANQLKRGKPLSGNLATAAKFGQAFPKAAAEIRDSPGVSAVDALIGGVGGIAINPALAALPLGRIATREALLSRLGQGLGQASYAPGQIGNASLTTIQLAKRAGLPASAYAAQQK